MKDLKGIALASVGLLLVAGMLFLANLAHNEAQPHVAMRYHQYLYGLYVLFAVYALLMPVIFIRRYRKQCREEAKLRRLSSIVEHATDIIYITDRHGVIEYANPGFERATGYSRSETVGMTPRLVKSGKHSTEFYQNL